MKYVIRKANGVWEGYYVSPYKDNLILVGALYNAKTFDTIIDAEQFSSGITETIIVPVTEKDLFKARLASK